MSEESRPLLGGSVGDEGRIPPGSLSQSQATEPYQVYTRRWYILGVLALLNIINGMLWVSFSPIANNTAEYYQINATEVNMLSVVFMLVTIPFGLVSSWLLDFGGLRIAMLLSAWLNACGCALRVVSCQSIPAHLRYPILLTGQTLAALGQPMVMFAPTKIAALWFPASQRALANTVASVSNPLGIMVGNLLSPAVVKQTKDLPLLLYIYSAPAALGVLMTTFGICSSTPPTPPSASAAHVQEPFTQGLKKLAKNGSYLILTLSFGAAVSFFTVVNTLIEQMLCPLGYSDKFAGWCGALMVAVGLIGATVSAIYVDKSKKFEEVAKTGISLATICLIAFLLLARYPNMEAVLIILISLTGFFGFASNPVFLELSVECTYPVAEATSAGIMLMSSQVQSLVFILIMGQFARPFDLDAIPNNTCHTTGVMGMVPADYTIPNLCLCAFGVFTCILFTLGFKCDFKRMRAEQITAAEQIVSSRGNPQPGWAESVNSDPPIRRELTQREESPGHWAESIGPQTSVGSRSGQWGDSPNRTPPIRRGQNNWGAESSTGSRSDNTNVWLS